ncbi:DgyrCDS5623 [Dimorphilus gyrociliatus]|uniref:DgyrCDS5623 n=1 Tax=Dimorphilus gyrociliatus TaxID=2664684 RepID=A0A7I8VN56_9ANNE|nr:DgyrCDS5623 [Dimorphilus gyrociliatus]
MEIDYENNVLTTICGKGNTVKYYKIYESNDKTLKLTPIHELKTSFDQTPLLEGKVDGSLNSYIIVDASRTRIIEYKSNGPDLNDNFPNESERLALPSYEARNEERIEMRCHVTGHLQAVLRHKRNKIVRYLCKGLDNRLAFSIGSRLYILNVQTNWDV